MVNVDVLPKIFCKLQNVLCQINLYTQEATVFAKCHVLLQCSNFLLMPCDMPLKVMRIVMQKKRPCQDSWKIFKLRERWTNGQTDRCSKERALDAYLLQHTIPNKSSQGHEDEKAKPKSWSLTFFSPWLTPHSLFISLFFSLCLFLSFPLSSPCVVSLIGRQTACKCSNPDKSPGALVIGCALQHYSQSIKARWAPVNSFSLLLLWLWYCHIDSNFALNPSTTVLSIFCLFHALSLHFFFYFQNPQTPSLYCHSKTFLITLTSGLCYFLFSLFFLEFLLLSYLGPFSPHSPCPVILNFIHSSVTREKEKEKTEKKKEMFFIAFMKYIFKQYGWCCA